MSHACSKVGLILINVGEAKAALSAWQKAVQKAKN